MEPEVRVFPGAEEAAEAAARTLLEVCRSAPGPVAVALSGGSTPALLYRALAERYQGAVPWGRLEVFFGDERAVDPDHPDSNYRLARDLLLSRVPVPPERVHRMPAEEPDLARAASRYEEEVRRRVPPGPDGVPSFDLIWLGLGEDGHTASLFPGTKALEETEKLVAPNEVPALGTRRLTFTLRLLNAAKRVQFLVTGEKKRAVVRRILAPAGAPAQGPPLPAARVRPAHGKLEWLLDRAAAGGMEEARRTGGR